MGKYCEKSKVFSLALQDDRVEQCLKSQKYGSSVPCLVRLSLSVSLFSVCLSVSQFVSLSMELSLCLSVCLSVCLSLTVSLCVSFSLWNCLCLSLCVSPSLSPSVSVSLSLCNSLSMELSLYGTLSLSVFQSRSLSHLDFGVSKLKQRRQDDEEPLIVHHAPHHPPVRHRLLLQILLLLLAQLLRPFEGCHLLIARRQMRVLRHPQTTGRVRLPLEWRLARWGQFLLREWVGDLLAGQQSHGEQEVEEGQQEGELCLSQDLSGHDCGRFRRLCGAVL